MVVIRRSKGLVKLVLSNPRLAKRESFHGARIEARERDPSTIPLTNTDKQERDSSKCLIVATCNYTSM
jgi:hypothetical protein